MFSRVVPAKTLPSFQSLFIRRKISINKIHSRLHVWFNDERKRTIVLDELFSNKYIVNSYLILQKVCLSTEINVSSFILCICISAGLLRYLKANTCLSNAFLLLLILWFYFVSFGSSLVTFGYLKELPCLMMQMHHARQMLRKLAWEY